MRHSQKETKVTKRSTNKLRFGKVRNGSERFGKPRRGSGPAVPRVIKKNRKLRIAAENYGSARLTGAWPSGWNPQRLRSSYKPPRFLVEVGRVGRRHWCMLIG